RSLRGLAALQDGGGAEGAERRRPLLLLDERHLPEVLSGPADGDPLSLLAALDVAGQDDVDGAALLAFLEDALPGFEGDLGALVHELAQVAFRQRPQELSTPEQRQFRLEVHLCPHLSLGSARSLARAYHTPVPGGRAPA